MRSPEPGREMRMASGPNLRADERSESIVYDIRRRLRATHTPRLRSTSLTVGGFGRDPSAACRRPVSGGEHVWQPGQPLARQRIGLLRSERIDLQRQQFTNQTRLQERVQANQVDVSMRQVDGDQTQVLLPDRVELVHMVVVFNGSNRPIREVAFGRAAEGLMASTSCT